CLLQDLHSGSASILGQATLRSICDRHDSGAHRPPRPVEIVAHLPPQPPNLGNCIPRQAALLPNVGVIQRGQRLDGHRPAPGSRTKDRPPPSAPAPRGSSPSRGAPLPETTRTPRPRTGTGTRQCASSPGHPSAAPRPGTAPYATASYRPRSAQPG